MKKKKLLLAMVTLLLLVLCACGGSSSKEPEVQADYDSPRDAILAKKSGTDIVGKTVKVKASQDSAAGIIYFLPDTEISGNVYVTILTDDENRAEVLNIHKGDVVVVTVDSFDDHLKYSYYVYAKEYKIYK